MRENTAASARETGALRTSLVHGEASTLQLLTIEDSNGPLNVLALGQFYEAESARIARHLVPNHNRTRH